FVPLMGILAVLMGIGPISRWKRTSMAHLRQQLTKVALAAVALGVVIPVLLTMGVPLATIATATLALCIVLSMFRDIQTKTANKPTLAAGLRSLSVSYWGMTLAHLGFVLTIAGACLTSIYSTERSV